MSEFIHQIKYLPGLICISTALLLSVGGCSTSEERQAEYLKRAQEHYDNGVYIKARVDVLNILQINADNADARYLYAKLFEREKNLSAAMGNLQLAVELDPTLFKARVQIRYRRLSRRMVCFPTGFRPDIR